MRKARVMAANQTTVERAETTLTARGYTSVHGLMAVFGCDTYEQLAMISSAELARYEHSPKLLHEVRTFLRALGLKPAR